MPPRQLAMSRRDEWNSDHTGVYAAKVCCVLSQKSDELFHSAALRLSLPGLCSFLTELCIASHGQLFARYEESPRRQKKWWKKELDVQQKPPVTLLLHRIGEVTLKCIKSGRPLIHIMKVWSIVGPHFMQAACHKDRTISKKAVTCIHDAVTALLNEQAELPHFHFNEALIKPFENLLCLELCDIDVQDQIVHCLCEFVEANRTEISSGWRPLFGTLRVANSKNNAAAILEVFKIFLSTDNTLVFANAALDYILCLLSHIKNAAPDNDKNPSIFPDNEFPTKLAAASVDLCAESLQLLRTCAAILTAVHGMPKRPAFNLTHRVNLQLADSFGPSSCDDGNVLRVFYVLLDGLAAAAFGNRAAVAETLFELVRDLAAGPGVAFGLYCVEGVVLPTVRKWLRRTAEAAEGWASFKHGCGSASELVVDYLFRSREAGEAERDAATSALEQLLSILVECTTQPCENVALLGTSCIRHIILSAGKILTVHQWQILVVAIHRACTSTLDPLHRLSLAFEPNSDSFYGDLATVKVAARKDATILRNERLYELAAQVFLMQAQRRCNKCPAGKVCDCAGGEAALDDRSYVFLLYPHDSDKGVVRVPFNGLVIGILAHQMLVQTVSSALLQNLNHITPILDILQISSCSLRGVLTNLNARHVDVMLDCLEVSNSRAGAFDARPGLKFLAQKVGHLGGAANLYTQANTSEVVQIIVLIELCLDGIDKYAIDPGRLKAILAGEGRAGCLTDADYVESFLRKLRTKWNRLCESYVGLTLVIPEASDVEAAAAAAAAETFSGPFQPFRLSDFRQEDNDNISMSTDSDSYLEKDALPNLKIDLTEKKQLRHSRSLDESALQKQTNTTATDSHSTDDETNETAAKYNTKLAYEKYRVELNAIKYDKNTLLQMRSTVTAGDSDRKSDTSPAEAEGSVKQNHNGFLPTSVPPPQPVPPEIQQQRAISIFKDSEAYRITRIETMEACLELLGSLSSGKLSPLATILKRGAVLLVGAQDEKIKKAAEDLLQRMNISYIDHDDY